MAMQVLEEQMENMMKLLILEDPGEMEVTGIILVLKPETMDVIENHIQIFNYI